MAKSITLAFIAIALSQTQIPGVGSINSQVPTGNGWVAAHATHYGPDIDYPPANEVGYQPLDVGVGCSNGQPGGDPRWNAVLANGVYEAPGTTVWPRMPTVAVSERAWGGRNKQKVCFQNVTIQNAKNASMQLTAVIVDFCPTNGCLWPASELAVNVDLYGSVAWKALGGPVMGGKVAVLVQWPPGLIPNLADSHYRHYLYIFAIGISLLLC